MSESSFREASRSGRTLVPERTASKQRRAPPVCTQTAVRLALHARAQAKRHITHPDAVAGCELESAFQRRVEGGDDAAACSVNPDRRCLNVVDRFRTAARGFGVRSLSGCSTGWKRSSGEVDKTKV